MIKKLIAYDFDKTLINSPEKEEGKIEWSEKMEQPYPYQGWWGRPESLDVNVFNIEPFPKVLSILRSDVSNPEAYVIVLTNRMEKLRPQVQKVLDINNIKVDKLDMKRNEKTKGQRILDYISQFTDLIEINVYDDKESDIVTYKEIINQIPKNIKFNIYYVSHGNITLLESYNKILTIIDDEIKKYKLPYL